MPLTLDEQKAAHAAKLEKLIFDIMDAVNDGNDGRFNNLEQQLMDMALDIEVPMELRYKAKEAHDTAAMQMTDAGLARMAEIADAIDGAASGLRGAIRVAETGKTELFFPSLAATVAKAVVTFETFVKAAQDLQNELQASDQGDLVNKIQEIVDKAKAVKDTLGP